MPNCFQLTRKGEREPTALQAINAELCAAFNEPCNPVDWFHGWYNYIGFCLAMGKTFEWLKAECHKFSLEKSTDGSPEANGQHAAYWLKMLAIAEWLDEHFTADAWAEIGGLR